MFPNADAVAKLYGWQFTNETGKKVVLLLNSASTSKTEIDFSGIFSSGDNVKVTQYWSDIPYENNVSMGRGIEKEGNNRCEQAYSPAFLIIRIYIGIESDRTKIKLEKQ